MHWISLMGYKVTLPICIEFECVALYFTLVQTKHIDKTSKAGLLLVWITLMQLLSVFFTEHWSSVPPPDTFTLSHTHTKHDTSVCLSLSLSLSFTHTPHTHSNQCGQQDRKKQSSSVCSILTVCVSWATWSLFLSNMKVAAFLHSFKTAGTQIPVHCSLIQCFPNNTNRCFPDVMILKQRQIESCRSDSKGKREAQDLWFRWSVRQSLYWAECTEL